MISSLSSIMLSLLIQTQSPPPPHNHEGVVGDFYATWLRPNPDGTRSIYPCCNQRDCYQALIRGGPGHYEYRSRNGNSWRPLPEAVLEHNLADPRESPNEFSHVCEGRPPTPLCAVLGSNL